MMNREEIVESARNISDFLRMGEPLDSICMHLCKIQPKYATQWKAVGRESAGGERLGILLRKFKMWPDSMCAAVDAGEESGNMEQVLESVMLFQEDFAKIHGVIKSKLLGPSIFIVVGILIFVGFMTFVLPGVSGSIKDPRDRTGLIAVSDWFVMVKTEHATEAGFILAAVIFGIIGLFRSDAVRRAIMGMADSSPGLGDGLRSVMYGLWAKFMVILDEAQNIPIDQMIRISSGVLPDFYKPSTELLAREVNMQNGPAWATDSARWGKNDPRSNWPIRLKISLHSAGSTGNIKGSLGRAADPMIRDGIAKIEKGLALFNLLAMAIAAGGILTPMAGMMLVQLDVVNKMK